MNIRPLFKNSKIISYIMYELLIEQQTIEHYRNVYSKWSYNKLSTEKIKITANIHLFSDLYFAIAIPLYVVLFSIASRFTMSLDAILKGFMIVLVSMLLVWGYFTARKQNLSGRLLIIEEEMKKR